MRTICRDLGALRSLRKEFRDAEARYSFKVQCKKELQNQTLIAVHELHLAYLQFFVKDSVGFKSLTLVTENLVYGNRECRLITFSLFQEAQNLQQPRPGRQ